MNSRIFKYLLICCAVFIAKAKAESKIPHNTAIFRAIFNQTANTSRTGGHFPYFSLLGYYNNAQMFRSQTQRPVNVLKGIALGINNLNAYFNFLSYNFPSTIVGYVRSAKLILFPFHGFW